MSDAHPLLDDSPHEGPIRTPKQLILAIFFAFVIPIAVIVLLAIFVTTGERPAAGSDGLGAKAVAERIRPVAQVVVKDMSDPAAMKTGDQVFAAQCSACHAAGVAGAPRFGDAAAWAPRIPQGYAVLLNSALNGKGAMGPQRGGDHTDFEIGRAVVYMANKGGANFEEPKMTPESTGGGQGTAAVAAPEGTTAAPAANGATAATTAAAPVPGPTAMAAPAPSSTPAAATTAAPAVTVAAATTAAAAAPTAAAGAAPAIYTSVCSVCHGAGIAGAPKLGDKTAWAPRIPAGIDGLTASAIKGKGAMPPRGGSGASDAEIKAVVTYMVGAVK